MKNLMKFLVAVSSALFTLNMSAQNDEPQKTIVQEERPVRLSASERAEQRTDEMDKAISLDKKQYKKIYKIFLKEEKAIETAMENSRPMGPPSGGMGGGRPPQGGGMQGRSGMGGPGAGGPPSGNMQGGMPPRGGVGFAAQKATVGGKEIDSDEYIDEREEKFKKILSSEQYTQWRKLHPDPTGFFIK